YMPAASCGAPIRRAGPTTGPPRCEPQEQKCINCILISAMNSTTCTPKPAPQPPIQTLTMRIYPPNPAPAIVLIRPPSTPAAIREPKPTLFRVHVPGVPGPFRVLFRVANRP